MDIQEKYAIGRTILIPLFEMSYTSLRDKLKEICGDKVPNKELFTEGTVTKSSKNDEPYEIEVSFYDTLYITAFGISYKPEHSPMGAVEQIVAFDKFFKLT